jgi:hypothetical protein
MVLCKMKQKITEKTRNKLVESARKVITGEDPSHDFGHATRVLLYIVS